MLGRVAESGATTDQQRRAAKTLRVALNAAVRMKLIYANPANDVALPRHEPREMTCWTLEDTRKFLGFIAKHRQRALYFLALDSGMRQGEIFALHWPDVDLVEGVVTVRQSLEEINGNFRLKAPKTKSGRRRIWVGGPTVEALRKHRERMREEGRDVVRGLVFVNRHG
jgi:integrase